MGFKSAMATQTYDGLHFELGFSHTIHGFQVHNGFSHTIYGFQLMNGFANFHGFHYGLASHAIHGINHCNGFPHTTQRASCVWVAVSQLTDRGSFGDWLRKPLLDFILYVASHIFCGVSFQSNNGYLSRRLSGVSISCPSLLG